MSGAIIHKQARTTPQLRQEIRNSSLSKRELAKKYNTIRKWKYRDDSADRSHRPHRMHTVLNPTQEAIVAELRKSQKAALRFLKNLQEKAPFIITKLLTDHDLAFTDRFTQKDRKPSGNHAFDQLCAKYSIEHRPAPPRHLQTNGMVERFNGRISEILNTTHFDSGGV